MIMTMKLTSALLLAMAFAVVDFFIFFSMTLEHILENLIIASLYLLKNFPFRIMLLMSIFFLNLLTLFYVTLNWWILSNLFVISLILSI